MAQKSKKSDNDPKLVAIGNKLRSLRGDVKLRTVYVETGIPISTISEMENGKRHPVSIETLTKLAGYYHCKVDDILMPDEIV